jgi:hypothetical protein
MFGKTATPISQEEIDASLAAASRAAGVPVQLKKVGKPAKPRYNVVVAGRVAVAKVSLTNAKLSLDTFAKLDPLKRAGKAPLPFT